MPDVTLKSFLPGQSVGLYPSGNWLFGELPPTGAPKGSATDTQTVDAAGSVTFTGVAAGEYYAYADGRYVSVPVPAAETVGTGGASTLDVSAAAKTADYTLTTADFAGGVVLQANPSADTGMTFTLPSVAGLSVDSAATPVAYVKLVGDGELALWLPGDDLTLLSSPDSMRQVTKKNGLVGIIPVGSGFWLDGALDYLHVLDLFTGGSAGNNLIANAGHRSDIGHNGAGSLFDWILATFTGNGGRLDFSTNAGRLKAAGTTHGLVLHKMRPATRNQRVRVGIVRLTSPVTNSFRPAALASTSADTYYGFYLNESTNVWTLVRAVDHVDTAISTYAVDGNYPVPALTTTYYTEVETQEHGDGTLDIRGYVDYNDGQGAQLVCQYLQDNTAGFSSAGSWGIRSVSPGTTAEVDSFEAWEVAPA